MEEITINNIMDFLQLIEENKIKNVLLGNGFSLSHPELGDCFKFDYEAVFKKFECYLDDSSRVNKIKEIVHDFTTNPEGFLKGLRLLSSMTILDFYIDNLKDEVASPQKLNEISYSCDGFLRLFSNIFTINYDPLTYNQLFQYFNDEIVDGFHGEDPLCQKCIYERLHHLEQKGCNNGCYRTNINKNRKKKIYYLHGTYFFRLNKKNNKLHKKQFNKHFDPIKISIKEVPQIILEDRSLIKEAFLKPFNDENYSPNDEDYYFKKCFEIFTNTTGNILLFGISLEYDSHLFNGLLDSKYEKIFITYIEEDSSKIEELTKKFNDIKDVTFIKIPKNLIWHKIK